MDKLVYLTLVLPVQMMDNAAPVKNVAVVYAKLAIAVQLQIVLVQMFVYHMLVRLALKTLTVHPVKNVAAVHVQQATVVLLQIALVDKLVYLTLVRPV